MSDSFRTTINELLIPRQSTDYRVIDLFAGCGGLSLGFEAAGFSTTGFEMDPHAQSTYSRNLSGECTHAKLTTDTVLPVGEILIGGPPCQPFSVGGKQLGLKDSRDGFPIFIAAVERIQPEIFVIENVRGVLYRNRPYLDEITKALEELGYIVEVELLNAVNYGVPQNRERVIIVGHKGRFRYPEPLPDRPTTAGEALDELLESEPSDPKWLTESMDKYIAKYEKRSHCVTPRDLHLDRPARTLTVRNLAGATGDMQRVKVPDGRRRRLTVQEAARLQSFPDWFTFSGPESKQFKQIGNAVAPLFAYHLARSVLEYLESDVRFDRQEISSGVHLTQPRLF